MHSRRRFYYTAAFAVILIAEILIGMFAGGWLRGSLGDILIMPAMYFFIRIFTDSLKKSLPVFLFVFACTVELMQYLDLCGILGIRKGSLLSVITGTNGCFEDIVCYAAGTILIYMVIFIERRAGHE